MDAPNMEFVLAGSLEKLKAKGRLVLHGSHRPILVIHDRGRNSHNALTEETVKDVKANAGAVGMHVDAFYASTDTEIEAAFAAMAQNHAETLLIAPDEFFTTRMEKLATLSLRYGLPSTYVISEFAKAGGLMSYGPDFANAYREIGIYTGRVLKGEKRPTCPWSSRPSFSL